MNKYEQILRQISKDIVTNKNIRLLNMIVFDWKCPITVLL